MFSLSGKISIQISCFPCVVAILHSTVYLFPEGLRCVLYCITFQPELTYRLRRRTTFCWCAQCGRGVVSSSGGRHPYRSVWPGTCWRRYERLPEPLTTAVPTRPIPNVRTAGTRLREPSYVPSRRYGSLGLKKIGLISNCSKNKREQLIKDLNEITCSLKSLAIAK